MGIDPDKVIPEKYWVEKDRDAQGREVFSVSGYVAIRRYHRVGKYQTEQEAKKAIDNMSFLTFQT